MQPAHTMITKRDFILRGSCFVRSIANLTPVEDHTDKIKATANTPENRDILKLFCIQS